ncbi:MAG: HAMP domain-containing sensor histidine kinase [Firmicutes bacterium]|nr:HAMP domain-containing sensor histidine kinase [Bacillota bacterium]
MRTSVALKVVSVYVVIVVASLVLAGVLTNRTIYTYVINTTKQTLLTRATEIANDYVLYGQLSKKLTDHNRESILAVRIAAQSVPGQYVVVDHAGAVVSGAYKQDDWRAFSHAGNVVMKAFKGKSATGVYPLVNPQFEFVAVPFIERGASPLSFARPGGERFLEQPLNTANQDARVVVMFTRLDTLQRISSQIWAVVAQGLLLASLISAVVGSLLVRRLMRPIRQLRHAVERVRERDFAVIPVSRSHDEIADFARAFNDMVTSLRAFDDGQKRFLQNASHELKTPLMAIRGYAEGLRDGVFEASETFRVLDIVAQESVRLKRLVDELIYLSKLETLDEVYTFTQVDMGSIIYKTLERLYPLARDRGLLIVPDLPEEVIVATVDRDKLVQALLNLGANAIRHARHQIYIRLRASDRVEFVVEDDGEGLQDEPDKLFERFYHGGQGDTGLGLPIAKAIVEKHRGEIVAGNAESGGARFVIRLPRQSFPGSGEVRGGDLTPDGH